MCSREKTLCMFPEKLKEKPEACTPEQIKECHGDDKNHPCVSEKKSYAKRAK